MLAHPFAGPLLAGGIENLVDEVSPRVLVGHGENVSGDLDQVALQVALIPIAEDTVELLVGQPQGVLQDEVGFADQLHVAVLDPVVHHLDVVSRTGRPHPLTAGDVILGTDLGTDLLQQVLDVRPRVG